MIADKIVHFVYFETLLGSEEFRDRWERYHSSTNMDADVTLQESKKGDVFIYIAKHSCHSDEFQFTCTKGAKFTRAKQTEIKKTQLGGYSVIQQEKEDAAKDECSLFIFLNNSYIDTDIYKQAQPLIKLNIYKAYFENCFYTYILEYFIKRTGVDEFKEKLQQFNTTKPIVYTEIL